MSEPNPLESRVTELEMQVMHLQHELQQLSSVVITQQEETERLRQELLKFDRVLQTSADDDEQRDPLAERPPHY